MAAAEQPLRAVFENPDNRRIGAGAHHLRSSCMRQDRRRLGRMGFAAKCRVSAHNRTVLTRAMRWPTCETADDRSLSLLPAVPTAITFRLDSCGDALQQPLPDEPLLYHALQPQPQGPASRKQLGTMFAVKARLHCRADYTPRLRVSSSYSSGGIVRSCTDPRHQRTSTAVIASVLLLRLASSYNKPFLSTVALTPPAERRPGLGYGLIRGSLV